MDFSDLQWKDFESKADDGSDVATFSGVASTSDLDLHSDIIEPGAFGANLKNIPILRDHDMSQVIGGWKEFAQDGKSLRVSGAISLLIEKGRETYTLMKQGFLSGISVGYRVKPGGATFDDTGVRRIKQAHLLEASIVAVPANLGARVRSVKFDGLLTSREATRQWLKASGFGDDDIEVAMAKGFDTLIPESRLSFTEIDGHKPITDESMLATMCAALQEARGLLP